MELASNVLWLSLTLAAFGLWLARGFHSRPGRHSKRIRLVLGAVGLGCAVTFLIPAISFTDDLRCEQSSATKLSDLDISANKWRPCRHQHTKWESPPAAMVFGFAFMSLDTLQSILGQPETRKEFLTLLEPNQGRSPPVTFTR